MNKMKSHKSHKLTNKLLPEVSPLKNHTDQKSIGSLGSTLRRVAIVTLQKAPNEPDFCSCFFLVGG